MVADTPFIIRTGRSGNAVTVNAKKHNQAQLQALTLDVDTGKLLISGASDDTELNNFFEKKILRPLNIFRGEPV